MNTQNILQNQGGEIDIRRDVSEYFDLELVTPNVDLSLDSSEYYDFEIDETYSNIDVILDYSEFRDYTLGDSKIDYEFPTVELLDGPWILTQDDFIITTEDKYFIEYE